MNGSNSLDSTSPKSRPLHVLVLPAWYPNSRRPDYAVFIRVQTTALQNWGAKVGVIFPEMREISDQPGLSSLKENNFTVSIEKGDGYPVLRWRGWRIPKLHRLSAIVFRYAAMKLFRRYVHLFGKPDIILAHVAVNGGWAAAAIADKYAVPYALIEHSTHFARKLYDQAALERAKLAFSHAAKIFAVSAPFAAQLSRQFGMEVHYAPNFIDTDYFCPDEGSAYESLNSRRKLRLAFVGTLGSKKGVDLLIDAVKQLAIQDVPVELRIIGEGPEENKYKEMVNSAGLQDTVSFLGPKRQEEVRQLMRWADLFVLPSRFETFGIVLIEALSTGTPVVSTRCGGPESIVDNDLLGSLVDVDDSAGFAEAILHQRDRLMQDNQKIIELRRDIHTAIRARFSVEARAVIMVEELTKLARQENAI